MLAEIKRSLTVLLAMLVFVMSIGIAPVSAAVVFDEPVLLSQGKPSSATDPTSSSSNFKSEKAFDGKFDTRWCMSDNPKYPQSITVDLEQVYNLVYLDAYWFNMMLGNPSRVFKYRIWGSIDGNDYFLMADETTVNLNNGQDKYTNPVLGIGGNYCQRNYLYTAARYVRLEATGCENDNRQASAWEIQVFGYDTALEFDADGIGATSEEEGYEAALAADADLQTAWKASEQGEQSWTVDLGASYSIDEIGISWLDDTAVYKYEVQTGINGDDFETAVDMSDNISAGKALHSLETDARYVRVKILDCSDTAQVGICEVGLSTKMRKLDAVVTPTDGETGFDPCNNILIEFTNSLKEGRNMEDCIEICDKSTGNKLAFDLTEIIAGRSYKVITELEYGKEYSIALFSVNDVFGQSMEKEISFKTLIKKELSEIEFFVGEEQITSLTQGTVSARMTAKNNQGEAFSPCLIVLTFDKTGKLLDIAADEAELAAGEKCSLEASVEVSDVQMQHVEAYIWDGLGRICCVKLINKIFRRLGLCLEKIVQQEC